MPIILNPVAMNTAKNMKRALRRHDRHAKQWRRLRVDRQEHGGIESPRVSRSLLSGFAPTGERYPSSLPLDQEQQKAVVSLRKLRTPQRIGVDPSHRPQDGLSSHRLHAHPERAEALAVQIP